MTYLALDYPDWKDIQCPSLRCHGRMACEWSEGLTSGVSVHSQGGSGSRGFWFYCPGGSEFLSARCVGRLWPWVEPALE